MLDASPGGVPDHADRKHWMQVLAQAPADPLKAAYQTLAPDPDHTLLRAPEFGAVMVQGRMGGTGGAFNLGEMTVTRCSVRLADGAVGHAYIAGRDAEKARIAALCDAMLQGAAAEAVQDHVVAPMAALLSKARADHAAKAAATKVDFFTLVRGED
ncbi:MAG: phosphonate C-P lyase system protein PhnG [Pseudomonadota bacterium]